VFSPDPWGISMTFLARLFSLLSLMVIGAAVAVFVVLHHYGQNLPDYSNLKDYQPPTSTRLYAGDGRLLAEYATERRIFIPIDTMPKRVIQAFLSAEDKDFYSHSGIDPMGIARAILVNLRNVGGDRRPVGASTITQQVAKNFLLTNEVSVTRKIKEAILATRLEKALTKDRILELYLNEIFLGQRSYGVAAAALNYFNKALGDLTVAEAAYLASLPKAPNNYHPVRNHDAAMTRRNWVIDRMAENGAITAAEADQAKAEPLEMRNRPDDEFVTADYFAEEVRRQLEARYGAAGVFESGLTVRTSLDPTLQAAATKALRDGLEDYDHRRGWRGPVDHLSGTINWVESLKKMSLPSGAEGWTLALLLDQSGTLGFANGSNGKLTAADLKWAKSLTPGDVLLVSPAPPAKGSKDSLFALHQIPKVEGALVALDPHTGRVLAMVGGFSAKNSVFNRATQAYRQPGSSFKPFIYLAALDHGFTPSSLVLDAPASFSQGPGLPLWQPENYHDDFLGPTTLRVGIEKSRNVMTVRLAHALGMPMVVDYAKKFGIADDMPTYLSFALGAKETTPLRLTTAYAMLVNGGKKITPSFIDRVQDRAGKTVWKQDTRPCDSCAPPIWTQGLAVPDLPDTRDQIQDPRTAYQMVSILEGVTQRGTGAALRSLGKPVAGKTGTTNDSLDAWFVGFSPDLAVGVFVGYDEPKSLGSRETGASVSVPIWKEFMEVALKDKPATPFRTPSGLRLVRVDPHTGRLAEPTQKDAIWEAFLPGTEPKEGEVQPILDGTEPLGDLPTGTPDTSGSLPTEETPLPQADEPAAATGGLY
jgi:penicillin-binding protein 1A